ncbi:hypothetical protein B0H11DRAFT_1381434 [Mycena galericulata]|nr:hypothetical protein B0H11DRAFT_1381434 [Mycena galericulata]
MTVAMYQGDGSEEAWRQHVAKYEFIRHPNVMQLYGLTSSVGLRALVFHDELIPYNQFLNRYRNSPILTMYIFGYCVRPSVFVDYLGPNPAFFLDNRMGSGKKYLGSVSLMDADNEDAVWIRAATGQLCLDLAPNHEMDSEFDPVDTNDLNYYVSRFEEVTLDDPDAETIIISALDLDQYHELCSWSPMRQHKSITASTQLPVSLGSIFFQSKPQPGSLFKITEPLGLDIKRTLRWGDLSRTDKGEVMANSWIRYNFWEHRRLVVSVYAPQNKLWLAQANHIFSQLQTTSHFEDYGHPSSVFDNQ